MTSDNTKHISPVGNNMAPECPFLTDLFNAFNEAQIEYCVLRNYEGLPYSLQGSDLDILVTNDVLKQIRQIVKSIARKHKGFAIWRKLNDYIRAHFHCCGTGENDVRWGVHIDFMTALRWKGLDYYSVREVFAKAIDKNGVRVADPCDSGLIAFMDKLLYASHSPKAKQYMPMAKAGYMNAPKTIKDQIITTFGRHGKVFFEALETENVLILEKLARKLRRSLMLRQMRRSPLKVFRNKFELYTMHCYRLWERMGIFISVIGLDGAGKSTLIDLARQDFERLLHVGTERQHCRPHLLPFLSQVLRRNREEEIAPLRNPHARPPNGLVVSILRLAYCTVDFVLGYFLLVYPLLAKRGTVFFFDRYFYDYFIDPARYMINVPKWIISIFGWFIPRPDLIIFLTPDAEAFYQRKPHLSLEELKQQSKRMHELSEKLNPVIFINTSGEVESSRRKVIQAILDAFRKHPGWK